ncbi:MAG TPA: thiol:disulfide interchange protein DsbA/DsbL [Casimicrobiaceae bacterium]|jgi:thiol:disulfide interchange protein DsbA|nr:thiol:disulfide interchange protein DsbA/DsbL [Casimicrobiaceae bacterium]
MSLSAVRLLGRSVIALVAFAFFAGSASAQLVEGKNYLRLPNPQPVETANKIEVIEFFSYGCPHCAALEPYLDKWLDTLPPDVAFRRIPVMFHPDWVQLAKIYYTLDAMGQGPKLSPEVFKAIHQQNVNLTEKNKFFDWAASKGLDKKKVEEVFSSFAIDGKVKRAMQLAQEYHIEGVPTVIVDGKFVTSSERVGTHANLPAAINELVAKARSERKS